MVVENHPVLEDGAPFPTLFWLTCPILVKRISRQEADGALASESERLRADRVLTARQATATQRYTARRDGHERLDPAPSPPGGGPDRIKCLHAHVAHELADPPNPIGAAALARAGWPECIRPCAEAT